jgi:hypothetical protein
MYKPVTTKEFEQSLFLMLATIAIVLLGVYFLITYNTPAQAGHELKISQFSRQNNTLLWDIKGVDNNQIVQLEAYLGNTWYLVGNDLAPSGQYALATELHKYRIVVRDSDGHIRQQSSLD